MASMGWRSVKGKVLVAGCLAMLLTSIPSALASHWSGWWGWVEHDFTGYGGKPIMDIWGPFLSEGDCQRALSEFMTGFRYVEDFDCEWTDKMSY